MALDIKETNNNPKTDGDSRFEKFMRNETNIQKPLREQIHKDIENTLIEIDNLKKELNDDPQDTIVSYLLKIKNLYFKINTQACKTNYDKEKHIKFLQEGKEFFEKYEMNYDAQELDKTIKSLNPQETIVSTTTDSIEDILGDKIEKQD